MDAVAFVVAVAAAFAVDEPHDYVEELAMVPDANSSVADDVSVD